MTSPMNTTYGIGGAVHPVGTGISGSCQGCLAGVAAADVALRVDWSSRRHESRRRSEVPIVGWRSRATRARSSRPTDEPLRTLPEVAARREGTARRTGDGNRRRRRCGSTDDILIAVGYSPYRKFKARTGDYVMIVGRLLVTPGSVAWAFLS